MSEEKRNRLVAAATVNIILLIVILAAVMIYQLAYISALNRNYNRIKSEYDYTLGQIENLENDLDYLQSEEYLWKLAHEQGYIFPNGRK